jgi:hypothetical protein
MKMLGAISIFCVASIVLADDFKTITGKEYKNVTVKRVEPDGLVLSSKSGVSKVYFNELPKDVQERFHYDAAKGQAYSAEQTAAQEALYKQQKEAERQQTEEREKYLKEHPAPQPAAPAERGQSVPSSMQGSMLDQRPADSSSTHGTALDQRPSGATMLVYGKVMQVVDEGLLVSVRETNAIGAERIPHGATVLVVGNFPGVYDDDKVQVTGRQAGSSEYTTVTGAKRTVRALTSASVTKLTEFPASVR